MPPPRSLLTSIPRSLPQPRLQRYIYHASRPVTTSALQSAPNSSGRQPWHCLKSSTTRSTPLLPLTQRRHRGQVGKMWQQVARAELAMMQMQADTLATRHSLGSQYESTIQKGELPDDFAGLLPGTLIMPPMGKLLWNMPEWKSAKRFALPRQLKVLRGWAWTKIKDFGSIALVWVWQRPKGSKRKIDWWAMRSRADALYTELQEAKYSNNIDKIEEICCSNVKNQILGSIQKQKADRLAYRWMLEQTKGSPQIVSHRCTPLPIQDGTGNDIVMRQTVAKFHTLQSLVPLTSDGDGEKLGPFEVEEYLVIQKRFYQGKDEQWKVYGTLGLDAEHSLQEDEWEATMHPSVTQGDGAKSKEALQKQS